MRMSRSYFIPRILFLSLILETISLSLLLFIIAFNVVLKPDKLTYFVHLNHFISISLFPIKNNILNTGSHCNDQQAEIITSYVNLIHYLS